MCVYDCVQLKIVPSVPKNRPSTQKVIFLKNFQEPGFEGYSPDELPDVNVEPTMPTIKPPKQYLRHRTPTSTVSNPNSLASPGPSQPPASDTTTTQESRPPISTPSSSSSNQ